MPRVDMESFEEGTEIVRVYLAVRLGEATRVEHVLDAAGVDYGVEVEPVIAADGLGLRTERNAAGFWVAGAAVEPAATALEKAGLVLGLVKR
jgi:hypothetical protein